MHNTYAPFVDRMISKYEGGYGWNAKDPGGPTKYGITCHDLAEHRGQKMSSMAAWAPIVQAMTLQEAEAIYATKYAAVIRYDSLPAGIDTEMMDYGVNSGTSRPINVARAITKTPGIATMDTGLLDAIHAYDTVKFIDLMSAERLRFMHAIRGGSAWIEFGAGWNARVVDLQAYSKHLQSGSPAPAPTAPDLSKVVTPKATNVPKTAGKTTTAVVVSTGGAGYAAGFPWWAVSAAMFAVFAAGIAYELVHEHAASVANNTIHLPAGA